MTRQLIAQIKNEKREEIKQEILSELKTRKDANKTVHESDEYESLRRKIVLLRQLNTNS